VVLVEALGRGKPSVLVTPHQHHQAKVIMAVQGLLLLPTPLAAVAVQAQLAVLQHLYKRVMAVQVLRQVQTLEVVHMLAVVVGAHTTQQLQEALAVLV
jgi:hypothetical protein